MNVKEKLRRLPKRILSFVLTLVMMLTLIPGMSVEVKAAAPLTKEQLLEKLKDKSFLDATNETIVYYDVDNTNYIQFLNREMSVSIQPNSDATSFTQLDSTEAYDYLLSNGSNGSKAKFKVDSNTNDILEISYSCIDYMGDVYTGVASLVTNEINTSVFLEKIKGTFKGKVFEGTPYEMDVALKVEEGNVYFDMYSGWESSTIKHIVSLSDSEFIAAYVEYQSAVYAKCNSSGDITEIEIMGATLHMDHAHDWKYSATDNKLEAYCANANCPSGTDATHKVSLTLNANNATYSGSEYTEASITGWETFKTATGLTTKPQITYWKVGAAGVTTGGTPKTAKEVGQTDGYYYAKISVNGYSAVKAFTVGNVTQPKTQPKTGVEDVLPVWFAVMAVSAAAYVLTSKKRFF